MTTPPFASRFTLRGLVPLPVLLLSLIGCSQDRTVLVRPDAGDTSVQPPPGPPRMSVVSVGGDADVPDTGGDSGVGEREPPSLPSSEPVCDATTEVNGVAELATAAGALSWPSATLSTTEDTFFNDATSTEDPIPSDDLAATGDFVATADLELTATLIGGVGAGCDDAGIDAGGFCQARLRVEQAAGLVLPGVLCDGALPALGDECQRIQIASGTRFRIRALVVDGHPGPYQPYLEVLRPCSQRCGDGELRCASTQLCWGDLEYCGRCDKTVLERCSCETLLSTKAEGERCEYAASPDVDVVGTCQAGFCVRSP